MDGGAQTVAEMKRAQIGLAESMEVNQELCDAPAEEVELGDGEVFEKELPREYEDLKMQE